ncbi:MAG: TAXI family TRAP transporter solute-binding subunit [Alphaproteobacteria bacterium]
MQKAQKIISTILLLLAAFSAAAREPEVFRIGTGTPGGTYFTVGALIAHAISSPTGTRACEKGGSCGVLGLEAVSKSSAGSEQNVRDLRAGKIEAAIIQSDIAWLAYQGKGSFAPDGPFEDLVAISVLWPEDLHLVVRTEQKISNINDLYNKPISLGGIGSGTLLNSELVLSAQNISIAQIDPYYSDLSLSGKQLITKDIDAFFLMAGWPVALVDVLLEDGTADLLSLDEETIEHLTAKYSWLRRSVIPKEAYGLDHDTITIGQNSLLVTTKEQSEDLIYNIMKSIWNIHNHVIYERGFQGQDLMQVERQKEGANIPFHKGSQRWLKETFGDELAKNP